MQGLVKNRWLGGWPSEWVYRWADPAEVQMGIVFKQLIKTNVHCAARPVKLINNFMLIVVGNIPVKT